MDASRPRSSSSSCSLNTPTHETTKLEAPKAESVEDVGGLFGSESDEEPAVSRAGDVKEVEGEMAERVQILPKVLEPPSLGFTEDGAMLPTEFELVDAMQLEFSVEKVKHVSEDVSLFAPGEMLDVDIVPFDGKEFEANVPYQKSTVRWRENADGERECNTRLVEWDDGSMSLYVEGKWYDLGKESFALGTELLCIDQRCCLQA